MNNSNLNDFLTKTLTIYTFLLVIIFILKLIGFDYFGLNTNNRILLIINEFCIKYHLVYVWQTITLYLYVYIISSISCNDKNIKKIVLMFMPVMILSKVICLKSQVLSFIIDVLVFITITLIKKGKVRRTFLVLILNLVYQVISLAIRNKNVVIEHNDFIQSIIFNFDYLLMSFITYEIYFNNKKGGAKLWADGEAFLFSLKKIHLKILLKKLQRNLDNFKKKSKVEKLEIVIYIILSLIWNTLSVVLILFVAKLNNTLIECIFILTSFWLSKKTFGKPFHFSSMSKCFVVSNLTYYALNRVTTPLGISIIVPIILGVGLSYVTSKFVKETTIKLYKGMPEEEFENSILKVTDKDSLQYKICHMFYVERKSELEIAHNVGYSIDNIKKIKAKINKKIKELN